MRGVPVFRRSGGGPVAPGHRSYSGSGRYHSMNRMEEAVAELRRERARRAIWANCERRPLGMDL